MKVIAFYLPQFHSFKENDEWWGENFTEWTNVKKAKPLFKEHYQPRVPLNNNYYNLLDYNTIKWQASLAKKYGIYGFCIYHYWFSGKLLMEKPVELLLKHCEIDLNYCFCWANDTWTKSWASKEDEILIKQEYGDEEEWKKHFYYFLPFFKDDRYIKINGKPMLVIYRPELIHCLKEMICCWTKLAIDNGLPGISFSYQQVPYYLSNDVNKTLFDYHIEYQPPYVRNLFKHKDKMSARRFISFLYHKFDKFKFIKNIGINTKREVKKFDYDQEWQDILSIKPDNTSIPCALVDWDNTPRRDYRGSVSFGANPEKFKYYFSQLIKKAKAEYSTDMIFVFAWNEWGECGYLEPDEKYKYAYLEAVYDSLLEENNND